MKVAMGMAMSIMLHDHLAMVENKRFHRKHFRRELSVMGQVTKYYMRHYKELPPEIEFEKCPICDWKKFVEKIIGEFEEIHDVLVAKKEMVFSVVLEKLISDLESEIAEYDRYESGQ